MNVDKDFPKNLKELFKDCKVDKTSNFFGKEREYYKYSYNDKEIYLVFFDDLINIRLKSDNICLSAKLYHTYEDFICLSKNLKDFDIDKFNLIILKELVECTTIKEICNFNWVTLSSKEEFIEDFQKFFEKFETYCIFK